MTTDLPEYGERFYRTWHQNNQLKYFQVKVKESDLIIGIDKLSYSKDLVKECRLELIKLRSMIESYIEQYPSFKSSLTPLIIAEGAPDIIAVMGKAAWQAQVGPMAAVAGALADHMGAVLKETVKQIVVENGGDIFLNSTREVTVAIFAGNSPFSKKIGIRILPHEGPLGLCTSSGTVGHSLSFGKADAVVIKAESAALADAAATQAANLVKSVEDFETAIEYSQSIKGIRGILIIKGDKMAIWGEMEIKPI